MTMSAPERERSVSVVSLPVRLAWLTAALWIVALKVALVAGFTPVELTTDVGYGLVYGLAAGLPIAALLAWTVRAGVRSNWASGIAASIVLGAVLYGSITTGLFSHILFRGGPWETEYVLYVHRNDPERRIERQVRHSPNPKSRFVQTRPLTPFLAYVEPVDPSRIQDPDNIGPDWTPGVDLLRYLK